MLCSFAGVPDEPVYAFLQHGWTTEPDAGNGRYASSRLLPGAPRLFWSPRQASEARAVGIPNCQAIGAPFLYLLKQLGQPLFQTRKSKGIRLLLYPSHSAEFIAGPTHCEGLDIVADAASRGQEITVVLHPLDFLDDERRARYTECGARVIRHATHRYDPSFLYRQAYIMSQVDEVLVFGLGSAAFHASAMGRPVSFFEDVAGYSKPISVPADRWLVERSDIVTSLYNSTDFVEFARSEMGLDQMRSPKALRQLLSVGEFRLRRTRALQRIGRLQAGIRYQLGDVQAGA